MLSSKVVFIFVGGCSVIVETAWTPPRAFRLKCVLSTTILSQFRLIDATNEGSRMAV